MLRLDRKPPRVRASASGKLRARVRIVDGTRPPRRRPDALADPWGDGKRSRGTKVTHRYKKPGTYKVTVVARDRAGNTRKTKVRVRVR